MACFVPANPPEVDASANPFSGMLMGAVATIYTARTMVGVRGASGADEMSHLNTLAGRPQYSRRTYRERACSGECT